MPSKLKPHSLWLLRYLASRMKTTGGGGYCVTNPLSSDAPPMSMSTMRGLERRGLVEEFHSGMFRPTDAGFKYLATEEVK